MPDEFTKSQDFEYQREVLFPSILYEMIIQKNEDAVTESNKKERFPISEEKMIKIRNFCQGVTGYKLDDFGGPPWCKQGTRRESETHVMGPFEITGFFYVESSENETMAYNQVEITNGRYKTSKSTKEGATACVARGEIRGNSEGSFSLLVQKGLNGGKDIKDSYSVSKDHDDDFGRHAEIAAADMCRNIINFIYDTIL